MDSKLMNTRERILETAVVLISQKGYAKTSTRDIAASLSIASPSLYHHFASKEAILAAILAEPMAYLEQVHTQALKLAPLEQQDLLLEGLLTALEYRRGVIVTISEEVDQLSQEFRQSMPSHLNSLMDLIAGHIRGENPRLRMAMASGAVRGAIKELVALDDQSKGFEPAIRQNKAQIKAILKQILFSQTT